MPSCENTQYTVCLLLFACVSNKNRREKERKRLGAAKRWKDKVREEKIDEWGKREAMKREIKEIGGRQPFTWGRLMILLEGHRKCRHGWVEYVLTHYYVKHWQISHALLRVKRKKIICIDFNRLIRNRQDWHDSTTQPKSWIKTTFFHALWFEMQWKQLLCPASIAITYYKLTCRIVWNVLHDFPAAGTCI